MRTITPASEALRLPSAKLDPEEEKIVEKLLTEIDTAIRAGAMRRNGFKFETNNTSEAAMFEVVIELRAAGYMVQCAPDMRPSPLDPRRPQLYGYKLVVEPSFEACAAAKRVIQ